ncbi:hypothetical protein [Fructobacillus evanidus]|uniref:Uncharacterized protein n=1 Tax=Fructobacillus evanidus TaxID=3064281 RepID=A0ABM9MPK4_9LACO|nr:unnamed protein product [Fructobacillus sp. LMG 32999]CAK1230565.1 unnamed protein product [Fructobacillus sp. LMG 32999]CAK1234013.1 unnamed protein product [Fructobacillus sp. LMG 32999]CAK1234579.1 unnamed protein product [Fructobacillus sp. LMG 32999]CAK1238683.1 unnamed protein product [Fructobacillus sp. LMG 32999]
MVIIGLIAIVLIGIWFSFWLSMKIIEMLPYLILLYIALNILNFVLDHKTGILLTVLVIAAILIFGWIYGSRHSDDEADVEQVGDDHTAEISPTVIDTAHDETPMEPIAITQSVELTPAERRDQAWQNFQENHPLNLGDGLFIDTKNEQMFLDLGDAEERGRKYLLENFSAVQEYKIREETAETKVIGVHFTDMGRYNFADIELSKATNDVLGTSPADYFEGILAQQVSSLHPDVSSLQSDDQPGIAGTSD